MEPYIIYQVEYYEKGKLTKLDYGFCDSPPCELSGMSLVSKQGDDKLETLAKGLIEHSNRFTANYINMQESTISIKSSHVIVKKGLDDNKLIDLAKLISKYQHDD